MRLVLSNTFFNLHHLPCVMLSAYIMSHIAIYTSIVENLDTFLVKWANLTIQIIHIMRNYVNKCKKRATFPDFCIIILSKKGKVTTCICYTFLQSFPSCSWLCSACQCSCCSLWSHMPFIP